jgi:hypothetical protein
MALSLLDGVCSGDVDVSEAAKNLREAHSYPETGEDEDDK